MSFDNGQVAQIEKLAVNAVKGQLCPGIDRRLNMLEEKYSKLEDQSHADRTQFLMQNQKMSSELSSVTWYMKLYLNIGVLSAVILAVLKGLGKF